VTALGPIARDGEKVPAPSNGGDWTMEWHPPPSAPPGQPHGANAFCVTADGEVVLISPDGERWGWPGGRPEPGESWEQTLRREILEEACATVTGARLLGFVRGSCVGGREQGLVLVRSIWRAEVALLPWRPEHEIPFRRTVPASGLAGQLWIEPGAGPIYARAAREAGLVLPGRRGQTIEEAHDDPGRGGRSHQAQPAPGG
jgi:ADP-ribose pyrophosphatase YjhB (NUDIX family)